MSELNLTIIKAASAMLMKFNNNLNKSQRESEETLTQWAEYLALDKKFTVTQIGFALAQLMGKNTKFMPSAYEIEACLIPVEDSKEDLAPIIVNEIIRAIRLHPYDLESRMFPTLSAEANAVIEANGGTRSIRDSDNFETMKAQLERLAKGVLASRDSNKKNAKLESVGIVLEMKRPEMKLMDYSSFLPNNEGA